MTRPSEIGDFRIGLPSAMCFLRCKSTGRVDDPPLQEAFGKAVFPVKHFRILLPLLVLALVLSACGSTSTEPSDTYLAITKGGGILAMILGLIQFFI